MSEHLFPKWTLLKHINDETYITTVAGYHIVISRIGKTWKYSCDFAGIYDRPLNEKTASLEDVKRIAVQKVTQQMKERSGSINAFLAVLEVGA